MKLPDRPLPGVEVGDPVDATSDCRDGRMTAAHIAKAAGVSIRAAQRAIEAYCYSHENESNGGKHGATLSFDADKVPRPDTVTCAEMGLIVAKQIGAGIFGIRKRAAERQATRPPARPKERRMTANNHPYVVGRNGRSVRGQPGGHQVATLTCRCGKAHDISFRQLAAADQMDRKFIQAGWRLDPPHCPACLNKPKEIKMGQSAASAAAMKAQIACFRLLEEHFNVDDGQFGDGWSDARIAKDTGLAPELVVSYRESGFGPLKAPGEIVALRQDIAALEQLLDETIKPIRDELANLRSRLQELRRRFPD